MKNIAKRLCMILFATCMPVAAGTLLPKTTAKAEVEGDFEYYDHNDGGVYISSYKGSDTKVVIPDTLGGKTVTAIGDACEDGINIGYSTGIHKKIAFEGCDNLTEVTIPNSVTSIGNRSFYGCKSLTSVTIPDSVTSIGSKAFDNCESLASIVIPEGVTNICNWAFNGTPWLLARQEENPLVIVNGILIDGTKVFNTVNIPDSVTSIGSNAFAGCSLESITIPNSVTSIGYSAFYNCKNLESITIPDSVTNMGGEAFSYCSSLTSIDIPDNVTDIGREVFSHCSSLTKIDIQGNVTSIGEFAFYYCSNLASVTMQNGVTSIEDNAFAYCSSLAKIDIPSSITNIGQDAFNRTPWLLARQAENPLVIVNGILIDGTKASGTVIIPDGVISIEDYAFQNCSSLTKVTIPDSVISIGESSFRVCNENLTIYTPAGSYAETWAKGKGYPVVNIVMQEGGASKPLAEGTKITVETLKCEFMVLPYDGKTPKVTYVKSKDSKAVSITVPDEVTYGGITYKVTSIESNAFSDCAAVKEVVLPVSLETIKVDAFVLAAGSGAGTKKKLNVKIPEGLEKVESLGLENVTNVIDITYCVLEGSNAQLYLNKCKNVTITIYQSESKPGTGGSSGGKQETTEKKPEINKKYTVKGLKYKVISSKNVSFAGAEKTTIKKLTIPAKVTISGQSYKVTAVEKRACKKYKKLETVVIGSNVKTIGDEAFRECKKLKKVTIGKNVTTINKKVFYKDKKLVRIVFKGAKVKKVGKRALYNVPQKAKITAPKKSKKKYTRLLNKAK